MKWLVDAGCFVCFVLALLWSSRHAIEWRDARAGLRGAQSEFVAVAARAAELHAWRAKPVLVSEAQTPSQHLLAMVASAGEHAGIAASSIKSVEGERDRPVAGGAGFFRQQSLRVRIEAVDLPEIGGFLRHWREVNRAWIATGVDLTPASGTPGERGMKWNCGVVFEHVYLAHK